MVAISATIVLKARPSWPSSSLETRRTRTLNDPWETVLAASSNWTSGWTRWCRSIHTVNMLISTMAASSPSWIARSSLALLSSSSSIRRTTWSISSTKSGMSLAAWSNAAGLPWVAAISSGLICVSQRCKTPRRARMDGASGADLLAAKRSSHCNRRSNLRMVSTACSRFSGCCSSLSVRKLSMRSDPETLTALARPLMSSAIIVEIRMETTESSARKPIRIPMRSSTELRRP